MPLSGNGMFVIMTMGRTKPGRETEVEMQRQKEKRTVPVGVCKDLIQGITKVVQSPTGTVKRLKSRSEISLFCTNLRSTGRMMLFDEGINREAFHQPVKLFRCKLSGLRRIAWPGEMTVFHAFGKEKALPEEPFDPGSTPAAEEKQGVRNKEGQVIPGLDDGSEGIHAVAHIRVAADYIDGREGGRISIPKHDAEP